MLKLLLGCILANTETFILIHKNIKITDWEVHEWNTSRYVDTMTWKSQAVNRRNSGQNRLRMKGNSKEKISIFEKEIGR